MDTVVRDRAIAVVVGGLLVGFVAVATVLATRAPERAEPGTPEAIAQGYFQALSDRDDSAAERFLAEDVTAGCDDLIRQFRDTAPNLRVVIVETTESGSTATVAVSITETYDSNLWSPNTYTFDEMLVMERTGDTWLISVPPWPLHCREG